MRPETFFIFSWTTVDAYCRRRAYEETVIEAGSVDEFLVVALAK